MQINDCLPLLYRAITSTADDEGNARLAEVGKYLLRHGFDARAAGFGSLIRLVRKFPDQITLWQDTEHASPVDMVRWPGDPCCPEPPAEVPVRTDIRPRDELTQWGYLFSFTATLQTLATMALPESWNSDPGAPESYDLLYSYIRYTFFRLRRESKVLEDPDAGLAAFNTGLVDFRYEPIYAVFEPNGNPGYQPWRFLAFCIAGEDAVGKRMVAVFNPLPEAAQYFSSLHDMYYDIDAPMPYVDYWHVLVENVARLPEEFLLRYCGDNADLRTYLESMHAGGGSGSESYSDGFAALIQQDPGYIVNLMDKMREAVALAVKRVRWNYRNAIPMYHPKRNAMSLLLPLSLVRDDRVDVALVVERMPSGNYQGQTILTLGQARSNARLVCRLDSDWLSPSMMRGREPDPYTD